ncbi:uncharacterized protein LOC114387609 [Glycine soja]|uniref:Alpha-L-arabinofuranosidase B arabinose-binding domain-containing protein n=1 Tax=Glycine soja TaxID=3848 RepID=A0A445GNI3_GLYSO|nr:uncharacterized protein LOC114387609 [Glycine soja]KHN33334.1 hypothetical protein glysoja_005376 [Glycine soja]RZB62845.1 hypothetical protein D0Y65_039841 [Glycine soja]
MAFLFAFVAIVVWGCAAGKECTNNDAQSHTFRYQLSTSTNETWNIMSHNHLTTKDDHLLADLLPRKLLKEENQRNLDMLRKIEKVGVLKPPQQPQDFLKPVSLHDVRLSQGSIHAQAQQTNLEYLLMLDVDRLLWSFRKTAGLPTPGTPYGGWEDPKMELRGHFVEPGVMIYMLPQGRGVSKAKTYFGWGTKFDSFWCCYGTGIESFSKLGDSIYFEEQGENPTLYIIQYISSLFNWKSGQIILNQTVVPPASWDPFLRVSFTFSPAKKTGALSTLNFRLPTRMHKNGEKGILNNETLTLPGPGNFLSITRKWNAGDKLSLQLPLTLRAEAIKDDRTKYASIQAILYGPYLLAGNTTGDWNIKTAANASIADWITPIPASYNSHLFYFSQAFANSTFVLTNSNQSLAVKKVPEPGTDSALGATFRVIQGKSSTKFTTLTDAIGKSVMLEPFDHPGMQVIHQGIELPLTVVGSSSGGPSSVFVVVPGLDGQKETISLESKSHNGCFVHSGLRSGRGVKLSCKTTSDATFNQAASFIAKRGISKYNPISFVAKGENRNFLLEPLLAFRDESYTVYFNIKG